jgi:hypothetical protein
MDVAKLILDYLQVFVWPALLVFVLLRFRKNLGALVERFTRESGEISASGFGLEITAKFREAREEIANLVEQADTANANELRESVKATARRFNREEFRALASGFYGTSANVRREVAREFARVATSLELDEVLEFARSEEPGERVGAAIALGGHMRSSTKAREDPAVLSALRDLLNDSRERVRYRAAEVLRQSPDLVPTFEADLSRLVSKDKNSDVRDMAQKALRAATR